MVPRKYIFLDADSMAHYLKGSEFNGLLLNGVLTIKNRQQYPMLYMDTLPIFNEAYYYATRVLFEQFPEMDIMKDYINDCTARIKDEVAPHVIFAMVYIILSSMSDIPDKAKRFCNQLQNIYRYRDGYMDEITSVWRECDRRGIHSDWEWYPPIIDCFENREAPVDWKDATDDFNFDNIQSYMDCCVVANTKYDILSTIQERLLDEHKANPEQYPINLVAKVTLLLTKVREEKEAEDKKWEEERAAMGPTIEAEFVDPKDYVFGSDKYADAVIELKDAEITRLNGVIEANTDRIKELNELAAGLQEKLDKALTLAKELQDQQPEEDSSDYADEEGQGTQKVITNYMFAILKKAGMGKETADYNKTDVANLIHYFTGLSSNTIRTTLTYPRLSSSSSKEVKKVEALLKKINLDISIE